MQFECRPVDASFLDTAPWRFDNAIEIDAAPARIFAALEDGPSWPRWFHAMHKVVMTSPEPYGVGTTRTVSLAAATVDEQFFAWEQDRRFSFCATRTTAPLAHAMAEDYLLEDLGEGRTRFTYRVALEPHLAVAVGGPFSRMYFDGMFRSACQNLKTYIEASAPGAKG